MQRKAEFSAQTRRDIVKSFCLQSAGMSTSGGAAEQNRFVANLLHLAGGGVQVKPATRAQLIEVLKTGAVAGEVQGVVGAQPYTALKSNNSIFHNTYLLDEEGFTAHRESCVVAQIAQGVAREGADASSAETSGNVELVPSQIGPLNAAMDAATNAIVSFIDKQKHQKVLHLVAEYVVDVNEMLLLRRIVSLVTCPSVGDVEM